MVLLPDMWLSHLLPSKDYNHDFLVLSSFYIYTIDYFPLILNGRTCPKNGTPFVSLTQGKKLGRNFNFNREQIYPF